MNHSENIEGFVKLCPLDELKENSGRRFFVEDPEKNGNIIEVALFKVNGKIFALNNICPHQHSALIYDGFLEDGYVVCPAHGWKFKLADGKMPNGNRGLDSYEVKIINNEILVKVYGKKFNW